MTEPKPKPKRGTVGAAWRSRKGLFTLVALGDAEHLTGYPPDELRELHGVQTVMRIYADGTREEALRVPSDLVLEQSEQRVREPRTGKIARS